MNRPSGRRGRSPSLAHKACERTVRLHMHVECGEIYVRYIILRDYVKNKACSYSRGCRLLDCLVDDGLY